jgi:tartrate dehydrogenase/decarboxylase / D-malate dehydrogenase
MSSAKKQYRIAVIPGDGIGKEVMPEGLRVIEAAAKKHGVAVKFDHFDFASYDYYEKHGQMMPDDWKEKIGKHDAIYFGAVGWPAKIPDHISLWGSLIKFRREFDQYVNLRPVRLMPGVPSPLANRKPGDIDFWVVRENTEGEYSSVGGRMFPDTDREFVTQQTVMTRTGVDRILKFAFDLAQSRPKKHLTSATKSNGISITMPYWDERVEAMAKKYPGVKWDKYHIDILTANFVLHPDWFDVVVGSNLFGDILSDLGPACTGTIGIAPSGNINPEGNFPSVFEPVHGSAPDIAGQGIANPIGDLVGGDDAGASWRKDCRGIDRRRHRAHARRANPADERSRRQRRHHRLRHGGGRNGRLANFFVIARSNATKQSRAARAALDCFAYARNDGLHTQLRPGVNERLPLRDPPAMLPRRAHQVLARFGRTKGRMRR